MNNPELSNLVAHENKSWGLSVITEHDTYVIEGLCCDDRDTNLSCIGVAAMEQVTSDHKKIRVSDRITSNISKEIKFTY